MAGMGIAGAYHRKPSSSRSPAATHTGLAYVLGALVVGGQRRRPDGPGASR